MDRIRISSSPTAIAQQMNSILDQIENIIDPLANAVQEITALQNISMESQILTIGHTANGADFTIDRNENLVGTRT